MRATLYAIRLEFAWHWRVTLDFNMDRAYWYQNDQNDHNGISSVQIVRFIRE